MSNVTLVSKGQISKVIVIRSQPSGHDAAVTVQRSRLSGHGHVTVVTAVTASPVTCHCISSMYLHCTVHMSVAHFHSISRKKRNKTIKQLNGNGKNSLLISHWNLGSKKWCNKRNLIQAQVDQESPDIMFISEANLDELTPPHESIISGYNITLPKNSH